MSLSRRSFVRAIGLGGASAFALPALSARGHEAHVGEHARLALDAASPVRGARAATSIGEFPLRLDSNENPDGPGPAVLDAIRASFGEAGRYPAAPAASLVDAVARQHVVSPDNVMLGCGSTEVLGMAVHAFTSPTRALVTAAPTFEEPSRLAMLLGAPVRAVRVDVGLQLDLQAMAAACGTTTPAGLVYVCNPNNPTGTHRDAAAVEQFVERVAREVPTATVLIDEAYFEYVEDPAYATAIPLALERPRVIVSRTFSKVYGLAGLRVGYAIARPETIDQLSPYKLTHSVGALAAAAGFAALERSDRVARERTLNREARDATRRFFESLGYRVAPSQTNFLLVDVRQDAQEFQEACAKRGVLVGRPFPPLDTYSRISIGTMEEMRSAMGAFRQVLGVA